MIYWTYDNETYRVWHKEWPEHWFEKIEDKAAFERLQAIAKEFPNLIGPFEEYKNDND